MTKPKSYLGGHTVDHIPEWAAHHVDKRIRRHLAE